MKLFHLTLSSYESVSLTLSSLRILFHWPQVLMNLFHWPQVLKNLFHWPQVLMNMFHQPKTLRICFTDPGLWESVSPNEIVVVLKTTNLQLFIMCSVSFLSDICLFNYLTLISFYSLWHFSNFSRVAFAFFCLNKFIMLTELRFFKQYIANTHVQLSFYGRLGEGHELILPAVFNFSFHFGQ